MPPKFRTSITPRFSDFDLQGILNSRQYLDLIGEARTDQMQRCYKLPMESYVARDLSFVIRSFEIEYGRPILYGARFCIETWVEEMKGPIARIQFRFLSEPDESVHASGSVKYILIDMKTKKPANVSEEDKRVYLGLDSTA